MPTRRVRDDHSYIAPQPSKDLHSAMGNGTTQTGAHGKPEFLSACCNMVSLTAVNTSRMLVVSVACTRLEKSRAAISAGLGRRGDWEET